jgi:hypothetical protein
MRQFGLTQELLDNLPDQRGLQSRVFEPFLELNNDSVNSGIDELLHTLRQKWLGKYNKRPNVKRQQKFIDCLRIILLNLVRARVQAAGMTVGIASGKERLNTEKRYNPNFMSVSYFRTALSLLASEGIMTVVTPGYQYGTLAQVARYALTDSGVARLPIKDITRGEFAPGTPRELIILRDRDKRLCDYRDTQNTVAMRDALTLINTVLDNADISTTRQMGVEAEVGVNTTLCRIFNDETFNHGGRFYGGWWQLEGKDSRTQITIDGHPTAEADFTGLHASILFSQAGLVIPEDPYALVPGVEGSAVLRDHAKTTFNALLNAKSLRPKQPSNFDCAEHGMSPDEFRQSVIDAFPMLPGVFGSKVGVELQYKDSVLAERIMLHFVNRGIPILPVHDSFIIQADLIDELVSTMKAVFFEAFGQIPMVAVKAATLATREGVPT